MSLALPGVTKGCCLEVFKYFPGLPKSSRHLCNPWWMVFLCFFFVISLLSPCFQHAAVPGTGGGVLGVGRSEGRRSFDLPLQLTPSVA